MFLPLVLPLALSSMLAPPFPGPAAAQTSDARKTTGDIQISTDFERNAKKVYGSNQDEAIGFFESLLTQAQAMAGGSATRAASPSTGTLNYLNAAYLYCSIEEGVCPFILDAVLETDIINARIDNTDECPNMVNFWKLYLANGMERRHNYGVRTGHLTATTEFNQRVRPKYVRCKAAVKSELSGAPAGADFFRQRYREGSEKLAMLRKTISYLKSLKVSVPNLYSATGSLDGEDDAAKRGKPAPQAPKKKR